MGTALKTLSLRIRGVKTELEEAGLETENMAETTSQLQSKLLALTHGKVNIMLNKDEFKSTYDILKEMSAVWKEMTDVEQAAALELIGGKRQANILSSLISNFQTAEDATKSAADSTGSALAENEKVLDSIQGKTQKLTNSLQVMWNNAITADGVKMFLDLANAIIKAVDNIGLLQSAIMGLTGIMAFRRNTFGNFFSFNEEKFKNIVTNKGIFTGILEASSLNKKGAGKFLDFKSMSAGVKEYASKVKEAASEKKGFNKVTALGTALSTSDSAAKLKEGVATKTVGVASKAAAIGVELLNAALSMLTVFVIQAAITGLIKLVNAHKDAAEAAKEQAQASREEYESAKDNKQSVDDLITKYKELKAQKLQTAEVRGEIVSVQEEINSLVGEQASSLNLVNGNLDTQLEKLEKIAGKQAEITKNKAKESYYDANMAVNKAVGDDSFLFMNGYAYAGARDKGAEKFLQDAGYKNVQSGGFFNRTTFISDEIDKEGNQLENAAEKAKYLKSMIDEMESNYDDYQNSDVYSGLVDQYNAYIELVNARQQASKALLESTTSDFYYNNKELDKEAVHSAETLQQYRNKMVEEIANSRELKTAIKNGDISISNIYSYVDDFIASTEDFTAYYGAWKSSFQKVLTDDQKEFTKTLMTGGKENGKYIKSWFDDLSEEDKKLVYDIAVEYDDEAATWSLQNWKDQLESMQETIELSVDINLESETSSIEGLNTAIQESMSATGLSETSMKNLQGRYSELAAQGYDLSAMFEETTNGIHLNREAVDELEQAYASQKQEEFTNGLNNLKDKYNELTEKINNCNDASEKSSLIAERASIAQQISDIATLASRYDGLTSAYKAWQDAESAGSERDMYENVLKGFDTMDDEISRGWIDDGSIEFLELLTGRTDLATASTKKLKEVYEGLDKEINNAGYSVRDFFTVDDEGNSTNTGVYNFLETVEALESDKAFKNIKNIKDLVKRDKNGNIVSFDFGVVGGDEAIAEALGISEELVQIMLRAADDAGFVVNIDGAYKQLADLQSEAIAANDTLKELGKTDVTFDFNTSNISNIESQLSTAQDILDKFKDEDGNINLKAEGAEEAMKIVSTLQAKLDNLTAEKYGIGLTVEDKQFQEPLAKLQEYGHNIMTLNQLEINPKANTKEIKKINKQLNETVEYFANLDEDTKVQIGFDADDGIKEVKKKIENGEVKIPTTLDIQAKMGKSIEDLKKIALLNSGLLTKDQENAIKAELVADIEVEAGKVNTDKIVKDTEEKTDAALNDLYSEQLGQVKGLGDKDKKAIIDVAIDYENDQKSFDDLKSQIKSIEDKKVRVQVIAKLAQSGAFDKLLSDLDNKDKEVVIKALTEGEGDIEQLQKIIDKIPEEKRAEVIAILTQSGNFDKLLSDLDKGDKKIVIKALTEGTGDVDKLNEIISKLPPEIQSQVFALVDGAMQDLELVDGKLQKVDNTTATADAEVQDNATGTINNILSELFGLDQSDANPTANLEDNASKGISDIISKLISLDVMKANPAVNVAVTGLTVLKRAKSLIDKLKGDNDVNGTAHAKGTVWAGGTAHKGGIWGAPKTETALTGELGTEIIVRGNRWFTVGENGAEFTHIQKGDIIFNHKQTEELLKNGYVTSNNGRGKIAKAEGTAHVKGTAWIEGTAYGSTGKGGWGKASGQTSSGKNKKKYTYSYDSKDNSVSKKSKNTTKKAKDDFEEVFDWFEVRIEEINEDLDLMAAKLENAITIKDKNSILNNMIKTNKNELITLEKGYKLYNSYANNLLKKVPKKYRDEAKNGKIAIQEFKGKVDEQALEAIKNYREWAQKAADVKKQIQEIRREITELAKQKFDNIVDKYGNITTLQDNRESHYTDMADLRDNKGRINSGAYYEAAMSETRKQKTSLTNEKAKLQKTLDDAVRKGDIKKYSPEWYEMVNQIHEVDAAIDECNSNLEDYQNKINEINFDNFEKGLYRISRIADETQGIIDLIADKDVVGDYKDGNVDFTSEGLTQIGLYAQKMENYKEQSELYAKAIDDVNKMYKNGDMTYQEYIEKLTELREGQHDAIQGYEDSKKAIVDLQKTRVDAIKDGIEKEIDAYSELIDKKKEELDAEKDLYDFQQSIQESSKSIADLQRQLAALAGDNSASARAQRKKLEAELATSQKELQDKYYDRSVTKQQEALDTELEQFTELREKEMEGWDKWLEEVDLVFADAVETVESSGTVIKDTLNGIAEQWDLEIQMHIKEPWNDASTAIQNTANRLDRITAKFNELVGSADEYAKTQIENQKEQNQNITGQGNGGAGNDGTQSPVKGLTVSVKKGTQVYDSSGNKTFTLGKDSRYTVLSVDEKTGMTKVQNSKGDIRYFKTNKITTEKKFRKGTVINAKGAKIYDSNTDSTGKSQNLVTYIVKAVDSKHKRIKAQSKYKATSGKYKGKKISGWFKYNDVTIKKYAKGSKKIKKDQLALVDELGPELQLVAGKSGRLEYITRGSSIIPSDISENLMKLGKLDPSEILQRSAPSIGVSPGVHNTEINLNIQYGDMLKIENFNGDNPDQIAKIVAKQFEKHTKDLNSALRKYVR